MPRAELGTLTENRRPAGTIDYLLSMGADYTGGHFRCSGGVGNAVERFRAKLYRPPLARATRASYGSKDYLNFPEQQNIWW